MAGERQFPKGLRIRKTREYRLHRSRSRVFRTKHFVCAWASGGEQHGRLGITVAKKRVRSSVDRNRIKRLLREWYRLNHSEFLRSWDLVLIAQARSHEMGLDGITQELAPLIHWLNAKEASP